MSALPFWKKRLGPGPAWAVVGFLLVWALAVSWIFRLINPHWVELQAGFAAAERGDEATAVQRLTSATSRSNDPKFIRQAAQLALRTEAWPQAQTLWTQVLENDPKDSAALGTLAAIYQRNQQPELALDVFLHALEHGVTLPEEQRLQLAGIYRQLLLYEEAEALYRTLEGSARARLEWAEMLGWQGNYEEAVTRLAALVAENPGDRAARLAYARVLSWAGKIDQSVEQYQLYLQP